MIHVENDESPKRIGRRTAAESLMTRQALLDAAVAIFSEKGLFGAKLSEIATRAGVTKGAIYSHFDSREDLLVEACRSALRSLKVMDYAKESPDALTFVKNVMRALLAPEGKTARQLNLEVHHAATRSKVMQDLLSKWHEDVFNRLKDRLSVKHASSEELFSVMHFLFLGVSHIDAFEDMGAGHDKILSLMNQFAEALVEGQA